MKTIKITGLVILASLSSNAYCTDMLDAYWQAVKNDPTFRAAQTQLKANEEVIKQASAGLWPILTTSTSKTIFNSTRSEINSGAGTTTPVARNKPRSINVTITQPIFTYETYARIKQARATVRKAVADFQASQQDLIIRVANAYLDVLEAQDTTTFTVAEKKAIARQLDQAKQRYKVGLDAITSVYDAQASYDAVISREITARNDLLNRLESLGEITGKTYNDLVTMREHLPLQGPQPSRIDEWVRSSLRFNKTLLSARADVDVAREAVSIAKGAMIPTLNIVGTYDNTQSSDFGFGASNTRTKQIGLSVDVPVFQGGRLISEAHQAGYNLATTVAQLDATVKSTVSTTRQAYNSVLSGIGAVRADRQALKSSQSSLDSTEAAFKVGTRTMVDVLDKQRDLYNVKRRLASDLYNYIKEVLRLKLAAGTLNIADLEEINSWLRGPTAHTTTERFKPQKHQQLLGPLAENYEPIILAKREFMTDFRALGIKRPYLLNIAHIHAPVKLAQTSRGLNTTSQLTVNDNLKLAYDTIDSAKHPSTLAKANNPSPVTTSLSPIQQRPMRHNFALYLVDKELAKLMLLKPRKPTVRERQAILAELQQTLTPTAKKTAQTKRQQQVEILLGSYSNHANVKAIVNQANAITGRPIAIEPAKNGKKILYHVKIKQLTNLAQAQKIASDLHNAGVETAVVKRV